MMAVYYGHHYLMIMVLIATTIAPSLGFMGSPLRMNRFQNSRHSLSPALDRRLSQRVAQSSPSSQLAEVTELTHDSIRSWFLKTNGRRPEVFFSESSSKAAVIADAWKSVLTSLRVLESDNSMRDYTSVHVFPGYKMGGDSTEAVLNEYAKVSEAMERSLNQSSALFQPSFMRRVEFHIKPATDGSPSNILLVSLDTHRMKSEIMEYDDIDSYVPPVEDVLTNDIEHFPFPTIFDFISEINRPPDPFTMSELKFKFKIQDFKYDLTKMAKKKNPQEVVDGINCKLTRLQNWKEVLKADTGNMPDPFSDTADWSERVKMKYQSLKALAQSDPKRALGTALWCLWCCGVCGIVVFVVLQNAVLLCRVMSVVMM